jgi:acyl dehydratase
MGGMDFIGRTFLGPRGRLLPYNLTMQARYRTLQKQGRPQLALSRHLCHYCQSPYHRDLDISALKTLCNMDKHANRHNKEGFLEDLSTDDDAEKESDVTNNVDYSDSSSWIKGEVLDFAIDLRKMQLGDAIDVPYEITVTESIHDFWQSAFHSQDRISTSTPFARQMGLQDRVLPFSLMLFFAGGMTPADAAKIQVGWQNAIYHWPCFAGDTLRKEFHVQNVRPTSDGCRTLVTFQCVVKNQRDRICMTADKHMMFGKDEEGSDGISAHASSFEPSRKSVSSSSTEVIGKNVVQPKEAYLFRNHIFAQSKVLKEQSKSHSLTDLNAGSLILHRMNRSVTMTQTQQLASLARLTHERHFDVQRYGMNEILVPGGVVLGLTLSASSRDLHEILHEELIHANFINSVHPGDVVGAMTYVVHKEDEANDLEMLDVITIGVKDIDVRRDLKNVSLPIELFSAAEPLLPRDIEQICAEKCPILSSKIVAHSRRRILRQAPKSPIFLL